MSHKIPTYNFQQVSKKECLADVFVWTGSHPYQISKPHAHDFHEIMIFIKGGGTHDMDFTSFPIHDYSIHILPKDFIHQFKAPPTAGGFTIAVSDTYLYQLQDFDKTTNYNALFSVPQVIETFNSANANLKFYLDEAKNNADNTSYFLNVVAIVLLQLAQLKKTVTVTAAAPHAMQKIKDAIEKHFAEKPLATFYANKLGMSLSALNKLTKQHTGKTVIQLQNERIIAEIKKLLYSREYSLKGIAYELKFIDEAHFSKFFKNHTGKTPSAYRATLFGQNTPRET